MKTLGILGGMSAESTIEYYRILCDGVRRELGGLHSPALLISSLDFDQIATLQKAGDWEQCGEILGALARGLQQGGADGFLISSNTMHKVAPQVASHTEIPLLHICDALGARLKELHIHTAGLLGSSFTMEDSFFKNHLKEKWGISTIIPNAPQRAEIHRIIFEELCQGKILDTSRQRGLLIIETLENQGSQAVILGCTELGLLFKQADTSTRLVDTTQVHVDYALDWMLGDTSK